jgi:hypothetical protein
MGASESVGLRLVHRPQSLLLGAEVPAQRHAHRVAAGSGLPCRKTPLGVSSIKPGARLQASRPQAAWRGQIPLGKRAPLS